MKIYLVRIKKRNTRWFDNEYDLTDFLVNSKKKPDNYTVTTADVKIESVADGEQILEAIKKQNITNLKINASLGNGYDSNVHKLIELYRGFSKKTPWDKTRMTLSASEVYNKLITTPHTEKEFKKIGASNLRYLTYCVSDSVEWFRALLDVYPGIKKLKETCESEYVDPLTRGTLWRGHRTPEKMIKNFEKAKASKK